MLPFLRPILRPSIRIAASGPVDPALAWRRYADLDRWPTWSPQLRRAESDGRDLIEGLRGRVVGPLGVWADFTVLDVDQLARRWSWLVGRGPLRIELTHGVQPDGGGTSAWLELRGSLPVIVGYAPVAWYALHRLVSLPA